MLTTKSPTKKKPSVLSVFSNSEKPKRLCKWCKKTGGRMYYFKTTSGRWGKKNLHAACVQIILNARLTKKNAVFYGKVIVGTGPLHDIKKQRWAKIIRSKLCQL